MICPLPQRILRTAYPQASCALQDEVILTVCLFICLFFQMTGFLNYDVWNWIVGYLVDDMRIVREFPLHPDVSVMYVCTVRQPNQDPPYEGNSLLDGMCVIDSTSVLQTCYSMPVSCTKKAQCSCPVVWWSKGGNTADCKSPTCDS